ncbi:MAG: ATP-binding cassette, subfamily bacterial [Frankiaceae bacterium]|jgi:ATP-binding cassette subfamily B protein|nr:ATP-binding cassette, subfamily bacterial [Frankiaceae bacterium]
MDPNSWRMLRSYQSDSSVLEDKLKPGMLRRVWGFAKPYHSSLVFFLTAVVLDSLTAVATPLLFRQLIDHAIPEGQATHSIRAVVVIALAVAGLAVVDAALSLVERYYSSRIGEGLIFDLRTRVFNHVQRMPIAFFTRTQTGALVSRLNNDVIGAQRAFTTTLSGVLSNSVALVATVSVMLTLSWQIALLSLVLLPVFIVPAKRVGRRLQAITRESYDLNASMNATMTERFNISGALLVKLFGRPAAESASFSVRAERVRDIGVQSAMYGRTFFVALTLVASLATALVYGLGGALAVRGSLTVGTIVALSALLGRLYGPLTALSNVRVDVMAALVSFDRVFEVLDLAPAIDEKPDAVDLAPDAPGRIEFEDVWFRYPTAAEVSLASLESVAVLDSAPASTVLRGVSFTAEPGQLIALVGSSGAGKTTMSMLPTRMYDVQQGTVRVGGQDVRDLSLQSLRDAIGVVTQDPHLFHDTLGNNLRYAKSDATDEELWEALDAAQVGALVRSLPDGLETLVGDRGYRLSGGEKQRVAIARVLLKRPRIVILDEATAHLDSENEVLVQHALQKALAGRTSLVIAHRLSTVRDADQILVVDDGRIVERGTHDELVAAGGEYADLYGTQFASQAVGANATPE